MASATTTTTKSAYEEDDDPTEGDHRVTDDSKDGIPSEDEEYTDEEDVEPTFTTMYRLKETATDEEFKQLIRLDQLRPSSTKETGYDDLSEYLTLLIGLRRSVIPDKTIVRLPLIIFEHNKLRSSSLYFEIAAWLTFMANHLTKTLLYYVQTQFHLTPSDPDHKTDLTLERVRDLCYRFIEIGVIFLKDQNEFKDHSQLTIKTSTMTSEQKKAAEEIRPVGVFHTLAKMLALSQLSSIAQSRPVRHKDHLGIIELCYNSFAVVISNGSNTEDKFMLQDTSDVKMKHFDPNKTGSSPIIQTVVDVIYAICSRYFEFKCEYAIQLWCLQQMRTQNDAKYKAIKLAIDEKMSKTSIKKIEGDKKNGPHQHEANILGVYNKHCGQLNVRWPMIFETVRLSKWSVPLHDSIPKFSLQS